MGKTIERIAVKDVLLLKDIIAASSGELTMLNGGPLKGYDPELSDKPTRTVRLTPEDSDALIDKETYCIMTRALLSEPDASPIEMVTSEEFFAILNKYEPDLRKGCESVYVGQGYWSGGSWKRGGTPCVRIHKAFLVIKALTDSLGSEGWKIWVQALEDEARARGFKNFDEVIDNKGWSRKKIDNNKSSGESSGETCGETCGD